MKKPSVTFTLRIDLETLAQLAWLFNTHLQGDLRFRNTVVREACQSLLRLVSKEIDLPEITNPEEALFYLSEAGIDLPTSSRSAKQISKLISEQAVDLSLLSKPKDQAEDEAEDSYIESLFSEED